MPPRVRSIATIPNDLHLLAARGGHGRGRREHAGAASARLRLDWHACAGLDAEARLSRLAGWVLAAHRAGLAWSLALPGVELAPGDLIFTGTPAGVGPLRAGQTVRVEIEGIGALTNPVVDRDAHGVKGNGHGT